MDYEKELEQKAQRYDEAIRKAKITLDCCDSASITTKNTVYGIFPELKESEDERIRKELYDFIYITTFRPKELKKKERFLDWLERQSASINVDSILEKVGVKPAYLDGNAWCILYGNNIQDGVCGFGCTKEEALIEFLKDLLKEQGEQKPTDRVESKFKVGDTITSSRNNVLKYLIKEVGIENELGELDYVVEDVSDSEFRGSIRHLSIKKVDEWAVLCEEKKPAWSEEDERLRYSCIKHIEEELEEIRKDRFGHSEIISELKEDCRERINWLKSLKERLS